MAQQPVELILLRQLASQLATPLVVVDPAGDLLYFNEAAEAILGRRFDEMGDIGHEDWTRMFHPTDAQGTPIKPEDQPLQVARRKHVPAHRRFFISGLDGVRREIEATAFPLLGQNGRMLGAFVLFWQSESP